MSQFTTNIDTLATTFETSVSITNTEENVIASTSLGVRTVTQEEEQVENQDENNLDGEGDGDAASDVVVTQALDILPLPPVSSSPIIITAGGGGVPEAKTGFEMLPLDITTPASPDSILILTALLD